MPGLVQTLREAGILIVNATSKGEVVPTGDEAESVVAGICQTFTYDLMNGAMQQILAGAKFIGTNPDPTYPMEGNKLIPGAGSIVAAVRACSGVEPLIIGKPNPTMINMVIEDLGLEPSDVLVVGDRQDTDIESGRRAGCPTHLVLTGVTTVPPNGQAYSLDLRGLLDE
jgi:ribonucleotide monophosphatase NagD (HAD superfamily)